MKLKLGPIPDSPDFVPCTLWSPLREPSPWLFQLISVPLGFVMAAMTASLWLRLTPVRELLPIMSVWRFLGLFGGIIVVHELIHAAVHPAQGRTHRSILGMWPSRLMFYAHFDGELSRNRFVAILLMPLVVITIVPLAVGWALQLSAGWLAFVSWFNAMLACGDMFASSMVLFQIPATATVRNQGWRTFWKRVH